MTKCVKKPSGKPSEKSSGSASIQALEIERSRGVSAFFERQWQSAGGVWHFLTWPFEQTFYALSQLKRWRERQRATAPPVPVIVVGNITVGGEGKSPLVQTLAVGLQSKGLKVGVLLRGYKGTGATWPRLVLPHDSPSECGDEAVMHSAFFSRSLLANVFVAIDPLRSRGAHFLWQQGVDVIVCDDGLQHYSLARDFEIVVFNAARSPSYLLPRGPLREPLERLLTVGAIASQSGFSAELMARLPLVEDNLWLYSTQSAHPSPFLGGPQLDENATVVAIAAIGHPQRFFTSLREAGFHVHTLPFPDHYQFTLEDLRALYALGLPVVMTSKDQVKIDSLMALISQSGDPEEQEFALQFGLSAYVVRYSAQIDDEFIDHVWQEAQAQCAERLIDG